jgi:hypothetical protein
LTQALEKETDPATRDWLARGLTAVVGRLEPAEATQVGQEAARPLLHLLKPEPRTSPFGGLTIREFEVWVVSTLLHQVDCERVEPTVQALARRVTAAPESNGFYNHLIVPILEDLLTVARRPLVRRRVNAVAAAVGTGGRAPLAALLFLPAASEPLPCRLATQDLVDLLKLPTCVRDVRRAILNQLGNRYGRRFATHWDFVRYAQEQGLNLDFTTPPQRLN